MNFDQVFSAMNQLIGAGSGDIGAGSGDIGRSRIPNGDGMANDGWYD